MREAGFIVLIVPEAATLLCQGGMNLDMSMKTID